MTDLRTRAGRVVERLRARNIEWQARCDGWLADATKSGMIVTEETEATLRTNWEGEAAALIEALLTELDARADAERDRVVRYLVRLDAATPETNLLRWAARMITANEYRSEP